jgi:hypothetical protein
MGLALRGRDVQNCPIVRRVVILCLLACPLIAAPVAGAGGPGKWTRISEPDQSNIDQPGLARTDDDVLHVLWLSAGAVNPAHDDLFHSAISRNGTLLGSGPVEQDWAGISDPALVNGPEGHALSAFFGGIRTTDSAETNDNLNWSVSSDRGEEWALIPGTVADGGAAYASPMGAARLGDVFWQAWGSTGAGAFAHRGTNPATPNVDLQGLVGGGCCGYDSNVATDPVNNRVMAMWFSNASSGLGVWAQELDPNTGAPVGSPIRFPGTVVNYQGSQEAPAMSKRTPLAALSGGGFVAAYPAGYPGQDKVLFWRVGAASSRRVAAGLANVQGTTVAATGDNRAWVAWSSTIGGKTKVIAKRSNKGAGKWGANVVLNPPKGTDSFWSIHSAANPDGSVDLLAVVTTPAGLATWHTQVRPGLTLAGPAKLARKKKEQTFKVTDADVPVGGAKVNVAGVKGTTGANGKVDLTLGPFAKKKKAAKGSAGKAGYTDAKRGFSIKKN